VRGVVAGWAAIAQANGVETADIQKITRAIAHTDVLR